MRLPGASQSMWRDFQIESFPSLEEGLKTEMTVIGAGITGITTAYLLVNQGYDVVLLDAGQIISGATGYTTAKISAQHGLVYDDLIETIGEEKAKLYYEANRSALNMIDDIRKKHEIDCDFSYQDAFVYGESEQSKKKIEKEAEAYEKLGIDGGLSDDVDLPFKISSAIKMKDQAQFHPVKYLAALVGYLKEKNVRIYENTRAVDIKKGQKPEVIAENDHSLTSDHVVIASHFPFKDFEGVYFARLHVERSYSLAVKTDTKIPEGMYLNADQPKRSIRNAVDPSGEKVLLVGGESHTSGQIEDTLACYENLRAFADEHFGVTEIPHRWSAQDMTTLDKVPYIGPITEKNPNIHVATGFTKWGMTLGTVAAQVLSDLISEKENPYAELFKPSRFNAKSDVKNFTVENADVAKEFVKGKIDRRTKEIDELEHDEGAVVKVNGKRAGCFKNSAGKTTLVDTTCTHMGCELNWNNGEKSWDCPCHGSRFNTDGKVIEGPATKPLEKLS
ncbi:FAD-dependent oxidoreductase [Bacillus sp. Marseille-Q3570]|uniref:FAD-dependent oxidoreductase n=1 Tax=Bacillus sp. Marseille-Q3570 TaxID=2963522 RepID=UPI0021B772C2|nr:FAD-dependent oxidoreductase [Bacillus sp. Marseille-Q3570]